MGTKKTEEIVALDRVACLKAISVLVDVLPEDQLEVLCDVLEKALFKETVRHYITKPESELKRCLTSAQTKKLNGLIKALVKMNVAE